MKIEVTEGQVLVEHVELYEVSDGCYFLLIDFKSKRPELVGGYSGNPAVFEFAADESTLRINKDGSPLTVISVHAGEPFKRVITSEVGRYACMAALFHEDPHDKGIVADWVRDNDV